MKKFAACFTVLLVIFGLTYVARTMTTKSGFVDSQNNNDWRLQIGSKDGPEGDIFAWKFVDGFTTCYVFVERNRTMWMQSSSCK